MNILCNIKHLKTGLLGLLLVVGLFRCQPTFPGETDDHKIARELVQEWNKLLLKLERHTEGYRPPISARMFAYIEMAAYESALPGLPDLNSVETFIQGYHRPEYYPKQEAFSVAAGINAAYATLTRSFFHTAPPHLQEQVNTLEAHFNHEIAENVTQAVFEQSAVYGKVVANTIWKWAATDSIGHEGNLYNFDRSYVPPSEEGHWQPSGDHIMPALAPHWGKARCFIVPPSDVTVMPPKPYSDSPNSGFYSEAMEVFSLSQHLSKENHWIGEFWSDDIPGLTPTAAGRWISIATQVFEETPVPLSALLSTYLKLGIGLNDCAVNCWKIKYTYNLERPQTYIQRVISSSWKPVLDAPPFPSYPSGHSVFGAVSAEILAQVVGDKYTFTDRTHKGRQEFDGSPRTYQSFSEMARENAFSRVALGVHFRMDCEEGLRLGKVIGQKINRLPVQQKNALAQ